MPIFHIGAVRDASGPKTATAGARGLGFFAHVPKCAGSAVEDYLTARFGPVAFSDRNYRSQPPPSRWNKSSPQHLPAAALERLFPPGFFTLCFAVVREPAARLASAFQVQRDVIGRIPKTVEFADWLDQLAEIQTAKPWYLDNHARAMDDLVPQEARIFRLEDGLEALVAWLDVQTGTRDGPRQIGQTNSRADIFTARNLAKQAKIDITPDHRARIAALFPTDFSRFGYTPEGGLTPAVAQDTE